MNRVLKGRNALSTGSTRLPARAPAAAEPGPAAASRPTVPPAPPAVEDFAALREEARRQGLEQGRREASTQAAAALVRAESRWAEMAARIEEAVRERLQSLEVLAVTIAFEACARVLGEAAVDSAKVAGTVRQLLGRARESTLLRVQLSPSDVAPVEQALLADPAWAGRALRFESDASLAVGECRVSTDHGQLETGLSTQLSAIQAALLAAFDAGPSGEESVA